MRIVKGDKVKVLYGKDAGKIAVVLAVNPKKSELVVEGVNVYTKHVKGDKKGKAGGILEIIKPMPIAKVQLVNDDSGKATRVKYETVDGIKSRVAVKGGSKFVAAKGKAVKKAKKVEDKKEDKKTDKKKK